MKTLIFIMIGALAFASCPFSWAGIGRVGNSSVGSDHEGFLTVLPEPFPFTRQKDFQLQMRSVIKDTSGLATLISAAPLRNVFSEEFEAIKDWPEAVWRQRFEKISEVQDWVIPIEEPCVLATRYLNTNGDIVGLATWGQGKGVVFSGSGNHLSWQAVGEMLSSIQLKSEDCLW